MRVVRYCGSRACKDSAYVEACQDPASALVDTASGRPNVTVRFELDGRPLSPRPSALLRDFVDLAAAVYVADELARRDDSEDGWTRQFDLLSPVHDPAAWRSAEALLQQTLQTLSGDRFSFQWCQRGNLPRQRRSRQHLPRGSDAVCLLSGGLDSLLGAYRLLGDRRKVILVSHQADSISAAAQTSLALGLAELFPGQVHHVQCRVARSLAKEPVVALPAKCEESHRVRSFLFLAIAIVIANAAAIGEIWMPENGMIALNIPLQPSRRGTLSTMTAHPLFMEQLSKFLAASGVFRGTLRNPFLYESKTDLMLAARDELKPLILLSNSCAHAGSVRWMGKRGNPHCGYCLPCIYRRFALIGVKLDDASDYATDVFRDLAKLSRHKQADLRALIPFAQRLLQVSDLKLQALILSHGTFAPEIGGQIGPSASPDYTPWVAMLRRWADRCLVETRRVASRETRAILGIR